MTAHRGQPRRRSALRDIPAADQLWPVGRDIHRGPTEQNLDARLAETAKRPSILHTTPVGTPDLANRAPPAASVTHTSPVGSASVSSFMPIRRQHPHESPLGMFVTILEAIRVDAPRPTCMNEDGRGDRPPLNIEAL